MRALVAINQLARCLGGIAVASLLACSSTETPATTSAAQAMEPVGHATPSDVWPGGNVYRRVADVYPRSATAVFYGPEKAADSTFVVRFGINANDMDANGQVIAGSLEAKAAILATDSALAVYQAEGCTLELRVTDSQGNAGATIQVTESGVCPEFGGTDPSGTYRPTLVGD